MDISLGWWLAPLAVTMILFGWLVWAYSRPSVRGDYWGMLDGVVFLGMCAVTTAISLLAWLIWALLR